MIMECHIPYAEARTYLVEWRSRIKLLVVPSHGFVWVVEGECPGLRGKVKVVRDFVPRLPPLDGPLTLPPWRWYFLRPQASGFPDMHRSK